MSEFYLYKIVFDNSLKRKSEYIDDQYIQVEKITSNDKTEYYVQRCEIAELGTWEDKINSHNIAHYHGYIKGANYILEQRNESYNTGMWGPTWNKSLPAKKYELVYTENNDDIELYMTESGDYLYTTDYLTIYNSDTYTNDIKPFNSINEIRNAFADKVMSIDKICNL